jgi:hypothetical protein
VAVEQRLEQDEPVPARRHQLTDHRVRPQAVAVERRLVALVVDLELRRRRQTTHHHVRAGAGGADQEDRHRLPGSDAVRAPPLRLPRGRDSAVHGMQLVLLDEPAESLRANPAQVPADHPHAPAEPLYVSGARYRRSMGPVKGSASIRRRDQDRCRLSRARGHNNGGRI